MTLQIDLGTFALELKEAVDQYVRDGGSISSIALEQERIAISSRYNTMVNLLIEQQPHRAKQIKNQARELFCSVLESVSAEILGTGSVTENCLNSMHKRLVSTVMYTRGGTEISLLNIMRTFTGVSLPYGAAGGLEWLTEELLELFCELAYVNQDWVVNGTYPKAPRLPKGFSSDLRANNLPSSRAELSSSRIGAYLLCMKSFMTDELDLVLIETVSIINTNLEHISPVYVSQPTLRTSDKAELEPRIAELSAAMVPIQMCRIPATTYDGLVNGSYVLSELISKQQFLPLTPELLASL